ncbi:MAG: ComF family protein [Nocardioides sp.]|nr:ComF family protein [Nocardioides sp.]
MLRGALRDAGPVLDSWYDLVTGSSCVGCGSPGRLLCTACRAALPRRAVESSPTPCPPGLVATYTTGPYDDTLKQLVIGFKERQLLGLRRPLGGLLALSVLEAVAHAAPPVVLVPVPSRPSSIRERGLDSTGSITSEAARLLRSQGLDVRTAALLRTRPGVVDQAGLGRAARAKNLAGSITCPAPGVRRLARACPEATVVICDDVVTTGSTAREAQRSLEAVGLRVEAVATVAATPRRFPVQPSETSM